MNAYELAKARYAALGVDTEEAIGRLAQKAISIHCWQGDDVLGFEGGETLTGGIQATGNYPGRARNIAELRSDMEKVLSYVPGAKKVNLHANYLDSSKPVARDELEPKHFETWVEWANALGIGLDFNTTFFSSPLSEKGSLTNPDEGLRAFWIRHAKCVRDIAEYFGRSTGKTCVTNHWIHDGEKEVPIDTV